MAWQDNRITQLFKIQYPVVQGGMVWCSGWRLASAVSNNGGLGLLGAGSMRPDVLREHIQKMKVATQKPWGVNVPLLYPEMELIMDILVEEGVKIVFTSAGSPAKWTSFLKNHGMTVVHVIANSRFAKKCEDAGVDAIVAEGFEAGGHNGREETTTMALIPLVKKATQLPIIAAGGIGSGRQMLAAMALGADGVQIGSRFALSEESSAHEAFKNYAVKAVEGDTLLSLKQLAPVRLLRNRFFDLVREAEQRCASIDELKELLGRGRARKGIFEGDLEEGELEIGQVAALIDEVKPVGQIFEEILGEYEEGREGLIG
ncbi:NAD(P)H-dependent flavin oxidoreductase [Geofilum rubicundum]|uniref:Enoyl-[acyl-carrier-protein] reductase n=1 Tax=Geofilum rubicundum JCM 15548 TaxID=1236989 RepID=A0A0E9M221_9BACT|nr:nitronate monooxygenase [Geofilum rubicundum]GAO31559.1 enoyl-[acyl-carrier-protein] reductase [Geofilum rubicundum JCM 15548]